MSMHDQPPPPGPPPIDYAPGGETPSVRTVAMLCHLLSLTGYITGIGFLLGPLIIWLIKKDEHPFIDYHGRESLNFQITMTIAWVVSAALIWVFCIGLIPMAVLAVVAVVLPIIAAVKANDGQHYRYPMTLRFL